MSATGTAVLDFGSFPGKLDASVAVTGQAAITTSNLVEAWILPQNATAGHSVDEHIMGATMVEIVAGNIVNATGFTIYGLVRDEAGGAAVGVDGYYRNKPRKVAKMWGTFNIAWAWG